MTICNLTPHAIHIYGSTATLATLEPSGTVARATETVTPAALIDGIPTTRTSYGAVEGLPAPVDGTWYVVSSLAADAAHRSGRTTADLLVPGQPVRDAAGRVIGCQSLIRWTPPAPEGYLSTRPEVRDRLATLTAVQFAADHLRGTDPWAYAEFSRLLAGGARSEARTIVEAAAAEGVVLVPDDTTP